MKFVEYISYLMMPLIIIVILISGEKKKVAVYDIFNKGASEGVKIIVKIFPSMLAVIVSINLFKSSGAMNLFVDLISPVVKLINVPPEVIPIGIMRSVSGGGALAVLTDILNTDGPDSFIGRVASTIMGSSDTTLYVLAIYTASVGITKTKNALLLGLLCDIVAVIVAVWIWI